MEFYEVVSSCEDVYQGSISPKWVNRSHAKKKTETPNDIGYKILLSIPECLGKSVF